MSEPASFSGDLEHKPWIGTGYESEPLRALLLGKAHYYGAKDRNTPDTAEVTNDVIYRYLGGESEPFYKIVQSLVGAAGLFSGLSTTEFWHRVAFVNFVPTVVHETRGRPTREQWMAGRSRFLRQLDALKPTHVLSLGVEQWNRIDLTGWNSAHHIAGPKREVRVWSRGETRIFATAINHPSGSFGFNVAKWAPQVKALIDRSPA